VRTLIALTTLAVALLAGCSSGASSDVLKRQLAGLTACLQGKGYVATSLTVRVVRWLPDRISFLPIPFLSEERSSVWIFDWASGGRRRQPISISQYTSTEDARRARARLNTDLRVRTQQTANIVFVRRPGDGDVAAAIAECIEPMSSKHVRRVPWVVDTQGPLADELLPVVVRRVPQGVARVGCSERPIPGGRTICAVTLADGMCEVWQIMRTKGGGPVDAAPMTPWRCAIVFGMRPGNVGG